MPIKPTRDATTEAPYVIVIPSPNAVGVTALTTGHWATGICDCYKSLLPNACMACWCPCVSLAQTTHRIGLSASYLATVLVFAFLYLFATGPIFLPVYWDRWSHWNNGCLVFSLIVVLMLMLLRGRVRVMLRIPGNVVEDCCCAIFCHCCALAQLATQVDAYDANTCQFRAKGTLPAFALS
ncbi:hypothetical protein SPRG_04438 [Saprolegnia parasitica CBS 223.65]|uniref:PLAC8 family protein n=1 Tax=Saprolegnia parasitica (strain CBS 223.65) TaxID=695850 RepID=A0A067CUS0_SAPPC|nr:hypothetical protein SPRG_04438 [Saprolegnia parasitica CBS 223.65]KDO30537.1 hypothetical protein SPRG_04438 [Saprolegnia parasitica CBS 223.65]|eukprot:XP_012198752.1 hypothetical protein SPRG_04438 [Saprolegnia parasitica CBS 223.65]